MENAILVGLNTGDLKQFEYSMNEMRALLGALNLIPKETFIQNLEHPVPATYIGSGKVQEISDYIKFEGADVVVFEDTLSPVQLRNLQKAFDIRILDRTGLILEIFSERARTREAKLQVESAKLQYMMPRLIGMWEAIGRQGGGSGSTSNKGIGETQLELDRRWIGRRIAELRKELDEISHDRDIQRRKREKGNIPLVSLVGYTNAGKSTIMNAMLNMSGREEEKLVLEKDMLFATLDTSVRKISYEKNREFLLSDTVGFLDKLPHDLIKAFRSTLEEVKFADLLLFVVDISDEHYREKIEVTRKTIAELGAENIPCIYVMNKADMASERIIHPRIQDNRIFISAKNRKDIKELISFIEKTVWGNSRNYKITVPYTNGSLAAAIRSEGIINFEEYREDGIYLDCDVPMHLAGVIDKMY